MKTEKEDFNLLLNLLSSYKLGRDPQGGGDTLSNFCCRLDETLWGYDGIYRVEKYLFDEDEDEDEDEDVTYWLRDEAFFQVEAIETDDFADRVRESFETMTDADYDLFIVFLDQHFQEGSIYFIREWHGNDNNVNVFKLHEEIYANLDEACKSCDKRLETLRSSISGERGYLME